MKPAYTHWNAETLWLQLAPRLPGLTVEVVPEIDSTNTELMRRARAGDASPCLLVAEHQTAGRGRQGRTWVDQPGDSLMFSLGLPLQPVDWSGLSLVVGLSVAESLRAAAPPHSPTLGVKWPNDLWLHDGRKLGGTLIETANLPLHHRTAPAGSDSGRYVVIGTGINVRAIPPAHDIPTNTAACVQEISPHWQAPDVLGLVLPGLLDDLQQFAVHGFAAFHARFARVDVLRGQAVHLSDGTSGTAVGVAPDGQLLLETTQGLRPVLSGDVSVRPLRMGLATEPPAKKGLPCCD